MTSKRVRDIVNRIEWAENEDEYLYWSERLAEVREEERSAR